MSNISCKKINIEHKKIPLIILIPWKSGTECYICTKEFNTRDKKIWKVKDHCHFTRKYGGTAHGISNFTKSAPKYITILL